MKKLNVSWRSRRGSMNVVGEVLGVDSVGCSSLIKRSICTSFTFSLSSDPEGVALLRISVS